MDTKTIWIHLLWKEYRQILPLATMVVAGAILLQLIATLFYLLGIGSLEARFSAVWGLAFCVPTVMAVACAGSIVGHERQTGAWNWVSSLPVSWRTSFAIKTLTSLVTIVMAATCVIGSAILIDAICGKSDWFPETSWTQSVILMCTGLAFEVFVALCFGYLIGRQDYSLSVLLSATILLPTQWFAIFFLVPTTAYVVFGDEWLGDLSQFFIHKSPIQVATVFIINFAATFAIVLAAVALVFRWRWSRGQETNLYGLVGAWLFRRSAQSDSAASLRRVRSISQPNTLTALLYQSAVQFGIFRGLVVAAVVLGTIVFGLQGATGVARFYVEYYGTIYVLLTMYAIPFLGITSFAGDNNLRRSRFLADRGISAWNVCLTRLLPAFVLSMILACIAAFVPSRTQYSVGQTVSPIAAGLFLFAMSSLASLCTANSVTAGILTIASTYCVGLTLAVLIDIERIKPEWHIANWRMTAWLYLAALILYLGCFWISKVWMIQDRPRMGSRYCVWFVGAILFATIVERFI